MVRNCYKKMRTAVMGILLCAFLSGCTGNDVLTIVSEEETASEDNQAKEETGEAFAEQGIDEQESFLYVHVCGAVKEPGVVALKAGSRAEDALLAAGGFLEEADQNYVNLAAPVEDGEKLYFPTVQEAAELADETEALKKGLVNINTADVQELCTLPGIGSARAGDIIAYREKNGGFERIEDIMKVSGIKESAFEKLKDKITTD